MLLSCSQRTLAGVQRYEEVVNKELKKGGVKRSSSVL